MFREPEGTGLVNARQFTDALAFYELSINYIETRMRSRVLQLSKSKQCEKHEVETTAELVIIKIGQKYSLQERYAFMCR